MKKRTMLIWVCFVLVTLSLGLIAYEAIWGKAKRADRITLFVQQTMTELAVNPEVTSTAFRDSQLRDNVRRALSRYSNHEIILKSYDDDDCNYEILSGDFLIGYITVSLASRERFVIVDFMKVEMERAKVANSGAIR
jgi:hypothetical protein